MIGSSDIDLHSVNFLQSRPAMCRGSLYSASFWATSDCLFHFRSSSFFLCYFFLSSSFSLHGLLIFISFLSFYFYFVFLIFAYSLSICSTSLFLLSGCFIFIFIFSLQHFTQQFSHYTFSPIPIFFFSLYPVLSVSSVTYLYFLLLFQYFSFSVSFVGLLRGGVL
jgi:hypothetical protein